MSALTFVGPRIAAQCMFDLQIICSMVLKFDDVSPSRINVSLADVPAVVSTYKLFTVGYRKFKVASAQI